MLDDATLYDALARCPPRSAEVVSRVGLDGWDVPTLAHRYGVTDVAAAVLLLRAARDFRATVERQATPAPPLSDAQEATLAAQLAAALATSGAASAGATPATGATARIDAAVATDATMPATAAAGLSVLPLAQDLAALRANRDAVLQRLRNAEAEAARSPARTREVWLRRLAILLILALTAWFYWRERQAPPPQPPAPVAPR